MVASYGEGLYASDEAVDITSTGVKLTLDTKDRSAVSVVLYHATNTADYVVECSDTDSETDADWHTLDDNDTTDSFRFQGTVPERFVRLRLDANAAGSGTGDAAIHATH